MFQPTWFGGLFAISKTPAAVRPPRGTSGWRFFMHWPVLSGSAVRSISSGQDRFAPFLSRSMGRRLLPTWKSRKWEALLASPDQDTAHGRRDHTLLLFLYNTGARADEAAQVLVDDLALGPVAGNGYSAVKIRGKGNKVRHCPLWPQTAAQLAALVARRQPNERVFLNRCGQPVTRFGIHTLVERHVRKARAHVPSLVAKRVSPHAIRHTTATHLLRAGVDINTIRAWLGHVSLTTTSIYAEVDLEMKAKALALCQVTEGCRQRSGARTKA